MKPRKTPLIHRYCTCYCLLGDNVPMFACSAELVCTEKTPTQFKQQLSHEVYTKLKNVVDHTKCESSILHTWVDCCIYGLHAASPWQDCIARLCAGAGVSPLRSLHTGGVCFLSINSHVTDEYFCNEYFTQKASYTAKKPFLMLILLGFHTVNNNDNDK